MIVYIQCKFLQFAAHKLNIVRPSQNFTRTSIIHTLDLLNLTNHRYVLNLSSFCLLLDKIDLSDLLTLKNLKVPTRLICTYSVLFSFIFFFIYPRTTT